MLILIRLSKALVLLAPSLAFAAPPDGVDLNTPTARWVQSWINGQNESCCGITSDCRPTQLRRSEHAGSGWEAWIDKATYGETAPDAWVEASKPAIEGNSDGNPSPMGWACWYNRRVICVSPAIGD